MHVHVTLGAKVEAVASALERRRPRGAKLTVIELWRGDRRQTDVMLTAHCPPREWHETLERLTAFARQNQLEVIREKAEARVGEVYRDVSYYELHVRAPNLAPDVAPLAANSINLRDRSAGLFLTFRARLLETLRPYAASVRDLDNELEEWFEAVIYDTNPTIDAWWAPTL